MVIHVLFLWHITIQQFNQQYIQSLHENNINQFSLRSYGAYGSRFLTCSVGKVAQKGGNRGSKDVLPK